MSVNATLLAPPATASGSPALSRTLEFMLLGGATLVLLPLFVACRALFELETSELVVGFLAFYAAYLVNDPHFSVTYLLFYKDVRRRALGDVYPRAQRLRYLVAGFLVPLILVSWGASAIVTRSAASLGLMMQLMFFLVGWHYVKQGFGVLSVLSAQRGVRFTSRERGFLLGHSLSAWFYARMSPFDPGTEYMEKGVVYTSLPHPPGAEALTLAIFAVSSLGLTWTLARKWRREGGLPLAPVLYFLVTVWLWVVFSSIDPLLVYVIPALHSLQYLYFVWLLKRNQALAEQGPPLFKRSVATRLGVLGASAVALGWLLFHGVPELCDDLFRLRGVNFAELGPTPFLAAFVSIVNLHHYFMDSVIWRRENPETRFLRATPSSPTLG